MNNFLSLSSIAEGHWIISKLGLLWIKLLWTFFYMSFARKKHSFPYQRMELLGLLAWIGTPKFSKVIIIVSTYYSYTYTYYSSFTQLSAIQDNSSFFHILVNTWYCQNLNFSSSAVWVFISHWSFNRQFSYMINGVKHVFIHVDHGLSTLLMHLFYLLPIFLFSYLL